MNLFDAAAIVLLVVAVVLGFRSGALPQIGGLGGAILGGAVAVLALPLAENLLRPLGPSTRAIAVVVWLLLAVGVGEGIGSAVGRAAARRLDSGFLGRLDRVAGAVVGAAQAVLIVWLAGGLLAAGPLPRLSSQAQSSTSVRVLSAVLPPPTRIAVELGRLLDASGLPEVFVGLEPIPAPPVDVPDDPRARAIARDAQGSVVKVTAETCGAISTGTGFAIARDYVVTNAHVVAGSGTVRVSLGGNLHDASPVLFDPQLDVSLLWVPTLGARPLTFAASDPGRGDGGAAIGFPAGGSLAVIPVAVAGRYDAQGRDIYGDERVDRSILELRAAIERGDSGGPVILTDGTVGGVVFAESRAEEDVGYALSPTSVAIRVQPSIGRTSDVDTGDCIR
ncbi:MAG TPA: MarP family serine protease [Candidatus Limnocylindrales bacterium]|nr:MarP family serine protease [Candidatus Limnocylindrales bacterium]